MEKVIIYARVATHSQTNESQVKLCKGFAESKGWDIDKIYDCHGSHEHNLVQLNQILEEMKVKGIGKLLTVNPSRISQTSLGLSMVQERFAEEGKEIVFLKGSTEQKYHIVTGADGDEIEFL
ncbi:recombinase family protein [Paenibacillus polymyxa]|uniref:recombinase family protein n=1 Tax=Paenibacillus polymyxa TaxID=1406 RepID=UPI00298BCBE6|nr:recombinase family protein [Paenibacillus polymyxa]